MLPSFTKPLHKSNIHWVPIVRARRRWNLISNKLYWHYCELVKLSELINYRRKKQMSLCVNFSLMTVTYPSLQHQLEHGAERIHSRCYTTTHILAAIFPGPPRWAATRKVKPIWILLKQETVSGNVISWAIYQHLVCTLLRTDNYASIPPPSFLQAGCPSCRSTYSIIALKWTYKVPRHLKKPIKAKHSQSKLNRN